MPKMMTHISVFLLLGLMAIGLGNCNDSPVRPKETNTCWRPLDSTITGASHSQGPAWSPSGKYVAFVGFFDSCNEPKFAIYLTEFGGMSRRALNIVGSTVRWLPPGDSMLIVNTGLFGGGELVKYNVNTDEKTPLGIITTTSGFDVSQNGRYIYYDDGWISERDLISGTSRRLIEFGGAPAISPNGNDLLYVVGKLNLFSLRDSSTITVSPSIRFPQWVNDTLIAFYSNQDRRISIMDLNGNTSVLTTGFGPISVMQGGRSVLFVRGSPHDGNGHIWIVDLKGGKPKEFIR